MFGKIESKKDTNKCGAGLGLSVCKKIVNIFEGDISTISEKDKGSKFTFTFKVKDF